MTKTQNRNFFLRDVIIMINKDVYIKRMSSLLFSSLRGRQLLSCLALRLQIGPNALRLTNQKPSNKGEGLYPP